MAATSTPSTWSTAPTRRTSSSGSANGWLAPYLPEEVAKYFPAEHYDPDGLYATTRVWLSPIGYNTDLVKAEDAPKSFADLLDPKWAGKMVKAHPAYSGTIMTATFQIARDLGWDYFEKLAKQRVMQVQSATDPPKKLALGERAVMVDGNDYNLIQLKESGQPVEVIYPSRGHAAGHRPERRVQGRAQSERGAAVPELDARARGPAAPGRLRAASIRRMRRSRRSRAASRSREIKLMKDDPAGVEKRAEEIKARYAQDLQGVMQYTRWPAAGRPVSQSDRSPARLRRSVPVRASHDRRTA